MTAENRQDNGLLAAAYVPLTDLDPEIGPRVLTALGRARIAAYLADPDGTSQVDGTDSAPRRRLYVSSDDRVDARTIVLAAMRGLGAEQPELPERAAPDDELDTRTVFDALVAGWHVDTVAAVRDAERELSREDADWRARLHKPAAGDEVWLDEDHYVPPAPPPLPRLSVPTILAILILAMSITLLAAGSGFGLPGDFAFLFGIGGILLGVGILFTRLRDSDEDRDDDGSAV